MGWIKNLAKKLILVLFGCVLGLLLAEGALRLAGKKPQGIVGYPRWYYIATSYGFDINPNFWPPVKHRFTDGEYYVWSNSLGCFDREVEDGEDPLVLIVGDSFTWGYTPFEDKWGTILEKNLGIRVLKCGVSGYGTGQAFIKAKKMAKKFPSVKLIVYSYYPNDFDDDYLFPHFTIVGGYRVNECIVSDFSTGKISCFSAEKLKNQLNNYLRYGIVYTPRHPYIQHLKVWLNKHSVLYHIAKPTLKSLIASIIGEKAQKLGLIGAPVREIKKFDPSYPYLVFGYKRFSWITKAFPDHLRNIEAFLKLNPHFVVTIIPLREQVYPELLECEDYKWATCFSQRMYSLCKTKECWEKPQKLLRTFLEEKGIPYLDYLPLFRFYADHRKKCFLDPKRDFYWKIDGHWSPRGNHLAGLLLARFLVKEGLIPIPQKA